MNLALLKKIRVAVSLLFFILTVSLFLDYRNILPAWIYAKITFLQFIPSLVKFITLVSLGALGFVFVLALTVFSGRIYCSTICPLGTLQDVVSFIAKKFKSKKKRAFKYNKETRWWRYFFLLLFIISFLAGTTFFINLLDPYSVFGKIAANLFRPAVVSANNLLAFLFEKMRLYLVFPFVFNGAPWITILTTSLLFLLVVTASALKGRWYCNTICPVGTFLGLLSKTALFKITIDEKSCKSCGVCEKVCKGLCISNKEQNVDFDRCVACYNCFDVCPTDGMAFEFNKNLFSRKKSSGSNEESPTFHSKRKFFFNSLVYVVGLSGLTLGQIKIKPKKQSKVLIVRKNPVTPPGSQNRDSFAANCTSCHLCVSACPTQVLQPAYLEYGLSGMFQPRMDYITGFCNFECTLCSDVCPTGAINPIPLQKKKITQLGKAKFVKDNCVVATENTDCGACSEHCPTKAVNMVPYKDKLVIPEVKDEFCIGCGACEFACPTKPYKAIYVEGNPIHFTAKKNEQKKIEQKVDYKEEFPF